MQYINFILETLKDITCDFLFSYNGFMLGLEIFNTGIILDNTISYKTKKIVESNNLELLNEGYKTVIINLLLLSPFLYYILENYLISNNENNFNFKKYCLILIIHSIGYYCMHLAMHKINFLKCIHKFHHKFTNNLIPSIGHAVSPYEFILAYALPFILASYILDSNIVTLNYAIRTVSGFNLLIHCNELNYLNYPNTLVSPSDHINHHKLKPNKNTYSAPIINLDYIVSKFDKFSSDEGSDDEKEE